MRKYDPRDRVLVLCYLAVAGLCCALGIRGALILLTPDLDIVSVVESPAAPIPYQESWREIPEFPALAPAREEIPDAGFDAGVVPFFDAFVLLSSVLWDIDRPWLSTVVLQYPRDDTERVHSLGDCLLDVPCNAVMDDWTIVRIAQDSIVLRHNPSGGRQTIELRGSFDAGAKPARHDMILIWSRDSMDEYNNVVCWEPFPQTIRCIDRSFLDGVVLIRVLDGGPGEALPLASDRYR